MRARAIAMLAALLAGCGAPPTPSAPPAPIATVAPSASTPAPEAPPPKRRPTVEIVKAGEGRAFKITLPDGAVRTSRVVGWNEYDGEPTLGPNGELAWPSGRVAVALSRSDGAEQQIGDYHFASGDTSVQGVLATALGFLDDGTLITGAADGAVAAFDASGKRLFRAGVRGAVIAIAPHARGVEVWTIPASKIAEAESTARSRTLLGRDGEVLEEAPAERVKAAFVLPFTQVASREVESILALPDGEVFTSGTIRRSDDGFTLAKAVFRVDGRRETRIDLPKGQPRPEVFYKDGPRIATEYDYDKLGIGPNGKPWLVGSRTEPGWPMDGTPELSALVALEIDGSRSVERRELARAAFDRPFVSSPVIAGGAGGAGICFGADRITCAVHDGKNWQFEDAALETSPPRSAAWIGGHLWVGNDVGTLVERSGGEWIDRSIPDGGSIVALAGSSPNDVWAIGGFGKKLYHYNGAWSAAPAPLDSMESVWSAGPNDVWIVGEGAAHYDGQAWTRALGLEGKLAAVAGRGPHEVWIGSGKGLWRSGAKAANPPVLTAAPAKRVGGAGEPSPMAIDAAESGIRIKRVTLPVKGGAALDGARGVASVPGGPTWLHDWNRVVEIDDSNAPAAVLRTTTSPLHCARCLAPAGRGEGWILDDGAITRIAGGKAAREPVDLAGLLAISGAGDALWGVVTREDDVMPRALVRRDGHFDYLLGAPAADYSDVAVRADGEAWLAGGLASTSDTLRLWPAGEGLLVHFKGDTTERISAPAPLLATAAAGPGEAWAVGADGIVIHVKGAAIERHRLASGAWLRAVWAAAPDDVWLGGDGATLLHFDGKSFYRVDAGTLGRDAAIVGIAGPDRDHLWAVSPSGILRITRGAAAR